MSVVSTFGRGFYALIVMGIRGLTSFISDRSDLYLKPYALKDSYLILDGYNVIYNLYNLHTNDSGAFGGDYDVFYEVTKKFFNTLFKCNIIPIVIFDGGHEKKKLKTIYKRNLSRVTQLKNYLQNNTVDKCIPLFLVDVFKCVIDKLTINCIQCFFEADREIAALAKILCCPVLSYDSDFFIFDVPYIPFNTLALEPKETEVLSSDKKFFLECSIFVADNLTSAFAGLKKCMFPLLAVLLDNDYSDSAIFKKLFEHISIPKQQDKGYYQRKILAVLNWLKNEDDFESAKSHILTHLAKCDSYQALQIISDAKKNYTVHSCTIIHCLNIKSINANKEKEHAQNQEANFIKKNMIIKIPNNFIKLYQTCKIPSFVMDMLFLNCYFVPTLVEDLRKPSCHIISFPIISAIYILLKSFIKNKNILKLFIKMENRYIEMDLKNLDFNFFKETKINNLLYESNIVKRNFFYKVLDFSENDVTTLENFDNNWVLFIMSFIYWIKKFNSEISQAHVHALLLTAICNFVQNIIGYYKDYSTFMICKSKIMRKLFKKEILMYDCLNCKFSEVLSHISELELLILTKLFIKFRKTKEIHKKDNFISIVHLNACFQSCLYYMLHLNTILNYPFSDLNPSEFYSGTIFYNFNYEFQQQSDIYNYITEQLSVTPNIANLYKFLIEKLFFYISDSTKPEVKRKKKKLKKKTKMKTEIFLQSDNEVCSENDYSDNENPFSLLKDLNLN